MDSNNPIRVTVWNEFRHEKKDRAVKALYPEGIHAVLAEALEEGGDVVARTATLDEKDHGLTRKVLDHTDVLFWWGHIAHDEVKDKVVDRIQECVLRGMGLVVLHSAHFAKIFRRLLGTGCTLKWREAGERERLWNIAPGHPVTQGVGECIELPHTEMYGEPFDVPEPDRTVFVSWFEGGEVFRSGCCWERGLGRVFYFRPGHETYPIYRDEKIRLVLRNAARWAAPRMTGKDPGCPKVKPREPLRRG